jgi:hypothetical protein
MTLLHDAVDAKKLDVRMIERSIARGTLTASDVEKSQKQLPDDAENAEYTSIEALANDGKTE